MATAVKEDVTTVKDDDHVARTSGSSSSSESEGSSSNHAASASSVATSVASISASSKEPPAPVSASASAPASAMASTSTWTPPPGHLGNLSAAQEAALDALRSGLRAEADKGTFVWAETRHRDADLLRFLRARKFDAGRAQEMVLSAEKWRVDFGVDEIMRTFDFPELSEVDKYYPQYYHKMDKDGRPIYIERIGKLDMKALYALTTQERLLQRLVFEYERFLSLRLPACAAAAGHPVETSLTILDLHNVSLSNFVRVRDYVLHAARIGQDRYPECMGRFYIINAPFTFSVVWAVIRPWLDEVTVSKVSILGSGYRPTLLAQIDRESLPREFGGECACEGGCSLSDAGPWNPDAIPSTEVSGAEATPTKSNGASTPTKSNGALTPTKSNGASTPTKPNGASTPTKSIGASTPTKSNPTTPLASDSEKTPILSVPVPAPAVVAV
ncbi:CRAL-TRIO domain-containing protein [Mycena rebaudengoi]|nr:CRAL-TRIO domain-containing protein [Mycena rebaudengoi]